MLTDPIERLSMSEALLLLRAIAVVARGQKGRLRGVSLSNHCVRQVSTQQGLYLQPYVVITFDLSVAFTQKTATPEEPVTFCWIPFVLPKEIAKDCRVRRRS